MDSLYLNALIVISIPIIINVLIRFVLCFISFYLNRKFSVKLSVNRVSFLSFKQISVNIPKFGVNIDIDSIGLSSKLLNQKYSSLIVIKLSDIRFEADFISSLNNAKLRTQNQTVSAQSQTKLENQSKLTHFIALLKSLSLLRFISVSLHNTTVTQLSAIKENVEYNQREQYILHTTIEAQQFALKTMANNKTSLISQFEGISFQIFKRNDTETSLAQISLSLFCNLQFENYDQICAEIVVSQPQIVINDALPLTTFKTNRIDQNVQLINNSSDSFISKSYDPQLDFIFFKRATLKLDDSSVILVRHSNQKRLIVKINSIDADITKTNLTELEARLIISNMTLQDTNSILSSSLNRISFITKFEREKTIQKRLQLFLVSEISSFHITYSEEDIKYWLKFLFKSKQDTDQTKSANEANYISFKDSFMKELTKLIISLDIHDISFSVKPVSSLDTMVTYGLNHTKIGWALNSDSLLREISFELLLETIWCWKGEKELRPANPNSLKRYHQRHVPLFMTMLLIKCRYVKLSDIRIHTVMDGLQVSLDYFIKVFNQYDFKSLSRNSEHSDIRKKPNLFSSSFQINLSSVNIFTSDLMLRIDASSIDSNSLKLTSSINGLAMSTMYAPSATLSSLRAAELIEHRLIYLSVVRLNCNYDTREATVSLTEEVYMQWNPSLHLTLIDLYDDLMSNIVKDGNKVSSLSFNSINLKLDGKISFGVLLTNSGNQLSFETEYFALSLQNGNKLSSKCEYISLNLDNHKIMNFENVSMNQYTESESSSIINRKKYINPSLETKRNKCISLNIENVCISFPYLYNFAQMFNERFISIIKWLRHIHKKSPEGEVKLSIAPDILVKIQNASMEVADDPFEVKLSDNYELLEDEYKESVKRWQMLSEKIEERRRKNILLPSSKLEELHSAFAKQNAKTYIDRSKKLYDSSPMRTRLFSVRVEGLNMEIIADSSYNTYDKMVSLLRKIDNESAFPEDLRFSTIWCRRISGVINTGIVSLRDFSQPMMDVRRMNFSGTVIGAEQEANNRAKRTCNIDVGNNFEPISIERSMTAMKFYHDLIFDVDSLAYTHGSCWEPVLQQLSICFELINRPSLDPSPSLSWWDKMRFLFHGSFVIISERLSILFHASLDPYNSTELIEISLSQSRLEWLTAKVLVRGNLDLLVHTASKYDECRIVHMPNVSVYINLNWVCYGNKNDHHSVMPCASDKVPEYSSNQMHDSYRSFRSHYLNISASLETKGLPVEKLMEIPSVSVYNSTLRWLENKMFMFSGIPRLTRRGKLFGNVKPRKQPFGRIFKSIRIAIYLHKFKICYWSSFNKQRGFEIISDNLTHSAEHMQSFVTINDNLIHRPKPVWDMLYMNSELSNVEVWLFKGSGIETSNLEDNTNWSGERQYFMSIRKVSYNRETSSPSNVKDANCDLPTHRLVVHDLRGAWTKDNRNVAFGLFDSFMKTQLLKRNLSTDAFKAIKVDGQSCTSPIKHRLSQQSMNSTSPASTISKGNAAHMLQKLIAEAENSNEVYSENMENEVKTENSQLHGVEACQTDDLLQQNWLIELINSQVVLRGCETDGYVIVSAAKTQILQRIHRPVWKNRTLFSKTTWQGLLECMQYYATVDAGGIQDNITWLSVDNIEERNNLVISELPDLVGSGQSVGGVVSSVVGTCNSNDISNGSPIQLQRIVSRCNCQFFYASFGENVDPSEYAEVPPLPEENDLLLLDLWEKETAVDTFTLTHHDLEISTNSQQFSMIVDLVNNLLLYAEPHKKELFEKQQSIRFGMQLSSIDDQKEPISQLQDKVRSLVTHIKRLERESYSIHKALIEERGSGSNLELKLLNDAQQNDFDLDECKEQLNIASEDLNIMINCFKEAQLIASKTKERQVAAQESGGMIIASVIRRSEVCFKHARWRLTDADGQLGLADLVLSSFLYTKVGKNDDSVEHSFELGFIHVSNLLPNQVYKDVLQPTELLPNIPVDRHRALRIFCRERAPVGGISVKEHLEVNVIPLTLGLTYAFFKKMLKFFFPDRDNETAINAEISDDNDHQTKNNKKKNMKRDESSNSMSSSSGSSAPTITYGKSLSSGSTTSTLQLTKDNLHIEKMRERAQKNQTFVYIKIPEVPITISYKGNKGKNLEDLNNVSLILPTIEYHNRTWTWLDLFMALKNDSKRVLLSQALKQKFHITAKNKSSQLSSETNKQTSSSQPEDEDKARLLLGNIAIPGSQRVSRTSKGLNIFSHK